MVKTIINLTGSKILNKKEQQVIHGGGRPRCFTDADCFQLTGDPTVKCYHAPRQAGFCLVQ